MRTTTWIGLLLAGVCAGFAIGFTLGKTGKRETPPPRALAGESPEPHPEWDRAPLGGLEKLRNSVAERQDRISELEAELAAVRAKLPPSLSLEDETRRRGKEEAMGLRERWRARCEKSRELRNKILQRKDKALRAQGLDEVAALLESGDREQLMLGLTVLSCLKSINWDKETFKPAILAALSHQDAEVRWSAMNCSLAIEEAPVQLLSSMVNDPFSESRRLAAERLTFECYKRREQAEDVVVSALQPLLKDTDLAVRVQAMNGLSLIPECAGEVDDMAIEMSRNPDEATAMLSWLNARQEKSREVAERLVEMYEEGHRVDWYGGDYYPVGWTRGHLADEVRPIGVDLCLRILRESVNHLERSEALKGLSNLADISVVPQLEEIARSDDAEGIEEELAGTIEQLKQRGSEQR